MKIPSYSKVFAIGHREVHEILDDPVLVQEKIDGSQISFGLDCEGNLCIRSKGAEIFPEAPPKMFDRAVEVINLISAKLPKGIVFVGEYLSKPKHNTLAYSRTPNNFIVLFDAYMMESGEYLSQELLNAYAENLEFEAVPLYFEGKIDSLEQLEAFLDKDSKLGGAKVEGVVIKNYNKFTTDKKTMMAKLVSEKFKEINQVNWKKQNPSQGDVIEKIAMALTTEERWSKAAQHLAEKDVLKRSTKDIGPLIREVQSDVEKECEDMIKQMLFAHFWPKIKRKLTHGLPEWYKSLLAEEAFEE